MPYLIDGHNLIPKLGLRLDLPDDEMQLVVILQDFCRIQRRQVEVFFDNAPPGQARVRRLGAVKAHFIRAGATADSAILSRLKRLGRSARNWTVVSSDRQVQADARSARAQVLTSEAFAGLMSRSSSKPSSGSRPEREVTAEEVQEWLEVFGSKGHRRE
jgi:predicted RNA-binding protein with PIN domain